MIREFIVLGVCTQYDTLPTEKTVMYHEFKKIGLFHSFDSALVCIFSQPDGRFRIVRRCGKKFFRTLTCIKSDNLINFV